MTLFYHHIDNLLSTLHFPLYFGCVTSITSSASVLIFIGDGPDVAQSPPRFSPRLLKRLGRRVAFPIPFFFQKCALEACRACWRPAKLLVRLLVA